MNKVVIQGKIGAFESIKRTISGLLFLENFVAHFVIKVKNELMGLRKYTFNNESGIIIIITSLNVRRTKAIKVPNTLYIIGVNELGFLSLQ